jgi:hypothetical protein
MALAKVEEAVSEEEVESVEGVVGSVAITTLTL